MTDKALDLVKLRNKAEDRTTVLQAFRGAFDEGNRDIARSVLPVLSSYTARGGSSYGNAVNDFHGKGSTFSMIGQPQPNKRLYNSTAARAWEVCSAGLAGGLSPSSSPWFKLEAADRDLRDTYEVKVWFDQVNQELHDFLAATNIYDQMQAGYGEIAWSGTEAITFTPHRVYGAVAHNLTWGSYWLGVDDAGQANTLLRDAPMTVEQLIKRIGSKDEAEKRVSNTVRKLIQDEKYGALVPVRQLIEPNEDVVFGSARATRKPWRSMYFEPGSNKQDDRRALLSVSGFDRKPFAATRWNTYGLSPYGWGPGMSALPESRKVQIQEIRYQTGLDFGVFPALQAPTAGQSMAKALIPGGITYTAATDANTGMRSIFEINPSMLSGVAQDISGRTEPAIRAAFYNELFQPITSGITGSQPRTAEEIMRRHEESLRQIGPITDRINTEKLNTIVLQGFQILSDIGRLPPLPDVLNGQPITVRFVSMLTQAQRMIGLGNTERAVAFLGSVAGADAKVVDLVDLDETVIDYWDRMGMPAKTLRNMEDVIADRDARAQQEQQAQMAAMMPAVKDGADALRLMTDAAQLGGPMAGQLAPGV